MRDLVLLCALIAVIPMVFRAPIVGLLAWIWISLMNPQREVYGFLHGFELNFYITVLTAMCWFFSKERKVIPANLFSGLLVLFGLWICVTTYLALDPSFSYRLWDRTTKTIVLALAVTAIANTKLRLQAVVWVLVVSIGYHAVKGGGFVIVTHGSQHVYGPENSMIADNNNLGLALVVVLPLMNYLRVTSRLRATRLAILATMAATLLSIIGTYSRGALLALGAAAGMYALRSRSGGIVMVLCAGLVAVVLPNLAPSNWLDRMATIKSYDEDASFEGRVAAWKTSINIVKARPIQGGGFHSVELVKVARQFPSPGSLRGGRAAHSIYFEVLGDHGLVGLGIYFAMLGAAWLNTALVLAKTRGRPELSWANELARMLQVSMLAFLVGGAALSMAYYDGFLIVFALTAALLLVVSQPAAGTVEQAGEPRWRRAQPAAQLVETP